MPSLVSCLGRLIATRLGMRLNLKSGKLHFLEERVEILSFCLLFSGHKFADLSEFGYGL